MAAVRVRRLEILAARLELIAQAPPPKLPREFDLNSWYMPAAHSAEGCGTTACAVGEACFIPELKAAGLKLRLPGTNMAYPMCNGRTGLGAAQELFGISHGEAWKFFMPEAYEKDQCGPADVASRIRLFVAGQRAKQKKKG